MIEGKGHTLKSHGLAIWVCSECLVKGLSDRLKEDTLNSITANDTHRHSYREIKGPPFWRRFQCVCGSEYDQST